VIAQGETLGIDIKIPNPERVTCGIDKMQDKYLSDE
jgi:hypothetical protein